MSSQVNASVTGSDGGSDSGTSWTADANPAAHVNLNNGNSNFWKFDHLGFTIPSGATITGLVPTITRYKVTFFGMPNTCNDYHLKLTLDGLSFGADFASATDWPEGSPGTASYGGISDLLGLTPTYSDINANSFAMYLSAVQSNGFSVGTDLYLTDASMTVYYTGGGGDSSLLMSMHDGAFAGRPLQQTRKIFAFRNRLWTPARPALIPIG